MVASNLKQVGLVLHLYSTDHDEKFPDDLEELCDPYVTDRALYLWRTPPPLNQPIVDIRLLGHGCAATG